MRILITGSADGLGRAAAETLLTAGHDIVVHARNSRRAATLDPLTRRGATLVVGDFSDREAVHAIASELNEQPPLDSVIHNAGVWSGPAVMPTNIIAPYLLTALLNGPKRHVYLSSSSHFGGQASLKDVDWEGRRAGSYEDSKLFVTTLAVALARLHPDVLSNAVDPGWVPTRMGGKDAPDDLEQGHRTQEWLATSDDKEALTSGRYWYHRQPRQPHEAVADEEFQDRLLQALAKETNVTLQDRGQR
jgi:NAD(P)-dependent dehydrogenase (short-subunit alcohol dehydrogenase family)